MLSLQNLEKTPRSLFLIDGIGALISAFLLGVVLVQFQPLFGMPVEALYILAALPVGFALYDAICYWGIKGNPSFFLKGIALINIGYCGLSVAFLSQHHESLTVLGWLYFVGELLIVLFLSGVEWQVAKRVG